VAEAALRARMHQSSISEECEIFFFVFFFCL
jgi:hypothetical protein